MTSVMMVGGARSQLQFTSANEPEQEVVSEALSDLRRAQGSREGSWRHPGRRHAQAVPSAHRVKAAGMGYSSLDHAIVRLVGNIPALIKISTNPVRHTKGKFRTLPQMYKQTK